jgi:hypothetical protein|tara:strand:- start:105 stop:590 length:486 start_codon:yes stop_codon:yes gene_type:complete
LSKLILRWNALSECIELHFKDKSLQGFLSSSISQNQRTWDKNNSCWVVVPEVLPEVINYSRHLFNDIDSSSIPIRYQTIVQETLQGKIKPKSTNTKSSLNTGLKDSSSYRILYLTPEAPGFVVKAVYKALAIKHHPDKGGDTEQFQELTEAYNKILADKEL